MPAKKSARLSMSLHSRVVETCFFNALSVSLRHVAADRIRPLHLYVKLFVCKVNGRENRGVGVALAASGASELSDGGEALSCHLVGQSPGSAC